MLTPLRSLCTAATADQAARRAGLSLWLLAALALAACGGGGGPTPSVDPPAPPTTGPPPAQSKGTVVIRLTTTAGSPVPDVDVAINGGFDGRGTKTDANGEARFTDVPAGDASTNTWGAGYHPARGRFSVVGDAVTTVPVVLESLTEAIPVLLAARSTPSLDGSTMSLELDIAVLDEQGVARETLTAVDFGLDGNCGWDPCLNNADGSNAGPEYPSYSSRVEDANLVPVSTAGRPALDTAILLDQSEGMAAFDPAGLRASTLTSFLASINWPDSVTLGSYYDAAAASEDSQPEIATYGPFTSDTADLRTRASSLPGLETGRNTIAATTTAIAQLVQFTSSHAPGAPSGTRRSLVVLDTRPIDKEIRFPYACPAGCSDAVQAARSAGVSVVAIGEAGYSYAFTLASRAHGAGIHVVAPEQLPPVFRGLDSILSGTLAYNRVRLVLDAAPGMLQPGRLVSGYLTIRIGPNTELMPWITVPIGQD